MMNDNYALDLTAKEKTRINEAIKTLKTVLMPKLVDLSSSEILGMLRMGDKTVAFVEKCAAHMEQNPQLVPAYVSLDDMKVDIKGLNELKLYKTPLEQVVEMVNDTIILSGSECYAAALAFYNSVKGAAKAGVPGSEVIYNDLKVRFPNKKQNTK